MREKNGKLHCISCGAVFEKDVETNEERDARILYLSRLDSAEKHLRVSPPKFDDAEGEFRDFIKYYPNHSDGYWGIVRARYGIKYEDDVTGKKIPSCYKSSYEDFRRDSDFMKALELAENDQIYDHLQDQAKLIASVCKEWRKEAEKYNYDVFISFKDENNELGISDADRNEMTDLYYYLRDQGYKVFFSPKSMNEYSGKHYDAYIFNALQNAKVMIVYGSRPEYFTSTWVQNEWTRFLRMEANGHKKNGSCIVVYNGFSPYELPPALRMIQAIDASKQKRFYGEILNSIKRILAEEKKVDTNEELMQKNEELQRQSEESQRQLEELKRSLEEERKKNILKQTEQKPATPSIGEKEALKAPSKATEEKEAKKPEIESDFEIVNGCLVTYKGDETEIVIPFGVTSIGDGAFANCEDLTEVVIPNGVTSIGDEAFLECFSLESITIPNSVIYIGNCAFYCSGLTEVVIPDSVTSIGNEAFTACESLSNITLSNNITYIGESAFAACESLTSVMIPDSVTAIGDDAFLGCENLTIFVHSLDQVKKWGYGWNPDNCPIKKQAEKTDETGVNSATNNEVNLGIITSGNTAQSNVVTNQNSLTIAPPETDIKDNFNFKSKLLRKLFSKKRQ